MKFNVLVKAEVTVSKTIDAETWEEAVAKAKTLRINELIPTSEGFCYEDYTEIEIIGIYT